MRAALGPRLLGAALALCGLLVAGCTATASTATQAQPPAAATSTAVATTTPPVSSTAPEAPAEASAASGPTLLEGVVVHVTDGDTVQVRLASGVTEKVRLIGIDTPESTREIEPYGKQASAFTTRELSGKRVWLEKDVEERDRYGRLLAYVWTAVPTARIDEQIRTRMFNARLVLEGYASQYTFPPNVRYADTFGDYAREARSEGRGLWAVPGAPEAVDHGGRSSAPAPQPTAAPEAEPAADGYVANSNTGKFHRAGCSSVDDMNEEHKVFYAAAAAARSAGYVGCKRCNP